LPDGKITRVVKSETNEQTTWNIYYKPLPVETISAYGDELKSLGFEIMKMQMPKGGQVTGQKGDLLVMCIHSEETTMLSVQQAK
jgi:hypothetical protein